MPRYIDAEALETTLLAEQNRDRSNAYGAYECDLIAHVYESARQLCERIPTADVEPVRHECWIEEDGVQICSGCGEEHEWGEYRAPYCDTCGAKMDRESEVEDDA